jgi:hypothetical protein
MPTPKEQQDGLFVLHLMERAAMNTSAISGLTAGVYIAKVDPELAAYILEVMQPETYANNSADKMVADIRAGMPQQQPIGGN